MENDRKWVQWRRPSAHHESSHDRDWSKWHIDTDTLHNERGRTGCGKRYPRHAAFYQPRIDKEEIANNNVCMSCWWADETLARDLMYPKED